jgi:hypothetical protein
VIRPRERRVGRDRPLEHRHRLLRLPEAVLEAPAGDVERFRQLLRMGGGQPIAQHPRRLRSHVGRRRALPAIGEHHPAEPHETVVTGAGADRQQAVGVLVLQEHRQQRRRRG